MTIFFDGPQAGDRALQRFRDECKEAWRLFWSDTERACEERLESYVGQLVVNGVFMAAFSLFYPLSLFQLWFYFALFTLLNYGIWKERRCWRAHRVANVLSQSLGKEDNYTHVIHVYSNGTSVLQL